MHRRASMSAKAAAAAAAADSAACWPWFKRVVLLDMFNAAAPFQLFLRKLVLINGVVSAVIAFAFFVPRAVRFATGELPLSLWLLAIFAQAALLVGSAVGPYVYAMRTNEVPGGSLMVHLLGTGVAGFLIAITNPSFPIIAPVCAYAIFAAICGVPGKYLYFGFGCLPLYCIGAYNTAAMLSGRRPLALDGYVEPTFQAVLANCAAGIPIIAVPVAGCLLQMMHHNRLIKAEQQAAEESRQLYASHTRNTKFAPTAGRIAILFTDIQQSTKLWGTVPLSMGVALDTHHAVIRDCIDRHEAFEVKTVGDSFMIAIGEHGDAATLALDIQRDLAAAPFPACIRKVYETDDDDRLDLIDDDPDVTVSAADGWGGLRVRIGAHCGAPDVVFDAITKGYDYYGPMVNVAARIEAVGRGGQICCSREFAEAYAQPAAGPAPFTTLSLGQHRLRGVADAVEILQLSDRKVAAIAKREFPVSPRNAGGVIMVSVGPSEIGSESSGPEMFRPSDVGSFPRSSMPRIERSAATFEGYAAFLAAIMTAFRRTSDRDTVIGLVCGAWRLPVRDLARDPEGVFGAIARRVGPTMGMAAHRSFRGGVSTLRGGASLRTPMFRHDSNTTVDVRSAPQTPHAMVLRHAPTQAFVEEPAVGGIPLVVLPPLSLDRSAASNTADDLSYNSQRTHHSVSFTAFDTR
jgi:class 3 adenylate cyclase